MMNIKYTLEGIYELLFEVKGDNCGDISEISYRAQTEIDLNKSQVSVVPTVRYGNRSGIFMEYGCRMVYNIPGLCDLVTYRQEDEKIEFAVDIMPVLLRTSMDTVRGILFVNTIQFSDIPLPIISEGELLKHNSYTVSL